MDKKLALKTVGGLSDTFKMPCLSYNIPAEECHIGSELRKIKNSVCSDCYACKGHYRFGNVQRALYRRFECMNNPRWCEAMIFLIKDMPYFRWHDSGDLQSKEHLGNIMWIANNTPDTKHWLPTRENKILYDYWKDNGELPLNKLCPNLCIRLSGTMIDGKAPYKFAKQLGVEVSEVGSVKYTCPASDQGGQCKDCRMCWNQKKFNVVYHQH